MCSMWVKVADFWADTSVSCSKEVARHCVAKVEGKEKKQAFNGKFDTKLLQQMSEGVLAVPRVSACCVIPMQLKLSKVVFGFVEGLGFCWKT